MSLIKIGIAGLALAGIGAGTYFGVFTGMSGSVATEDIATFTVKRGPLVVSVSEAGTIEPLEKAKIINRVEGRRQILSMVEEGTIVQEGDVIIELDSSSLENELIDQQIRVQNAEASFIRERENVEVAKSQATSDVSKAELDHQFAKEDLAKYTDGEFPKERKELESRITLAQEELERARDRYEGSKRLFAEKYIAETELEGDRLSLNRATLDHDLAIAELELLESYTYKRRLAELESAITQTDLALDRVNRKAAADVVQAEASLRASEAEYRRQEERLDKLRDQIAKCTITAPATGMIIFTRQDFGRNDEPLAAGSEVREREELAEIPTASSMMAQVSVHESVLKKVTQGLPVRIEVDAVPGRLFEGVVARIAPLPDQGNWWSNPNLKVYSTDIHFVGSPEGIRSGMTCRAQIIMEEFEDVMYVPVQCVVRDGDTMFALVSTDDGRIEQRIVSVGSDNNEMIQVLSGLNVGEDVVLAPLLIDMATVVKAVPDDAIAASDTPEPIAASSLGR